MTDSGLLLQTLARIEAKVDKVVDEVAELRGAKKAVFGIATLTSIVVSVVVGLLRRHL